MTQQEVGEENAKVSGGNMKERRSAGPIARGPVMPDVVRGQRGD
jgi:hypothetical protein